MHDPDSPIDEYTLAAFLAGTLPHHRRQEVLDYLAENPNARAVLHMAAEALEAAEAPPIEPAPIRGAQAGRFRPHPIRTQQEGSHPHVAAAAGERPSDRMRGVVRYGMATLIVVVIGVALQLFLGPSTRTLRSNITRGAGALVVSVDGPAHAIQWRPVEKAYRYRVVLWDPLKSRVVSRFETFESELDSTDTVIRTLLSKLGRGDHYLLRVDAVDAQDRLILSSKMVEFVYR